MATQSIPQSIEQSQPAVIQFPAESPIQISQDELDAVFALRNSIKQEQEELASLETDLKARLTAGAEVEEGTHTAELKEAFRRNIAWRDVASRLGDRLYGDGKGEAYCNKVLQSTKPTRTLSLQVQ